jgi:hypothetical protein
MTQMWKCAKENIIGLGASNEITVIRNGFFRYEAVQSDGTVVAKGIKLRKYYNPHNPNIPGSGALPGRICYDGGHYDHMNKCWVNGDGHYELRLENPKKLNRFDIVCVWR